MIASLLILLVVLFALSAAFSASETILFSLTPVQLQRIREKDPAASRRIERCIEDSALLLSTLLIGNTFVNFAVAYFGYRLCVGLMPSVGAFLAVPLMTVLLLLLGEITPKQIALRRTEHLASASSRFMLFWRAVFAPFGFALRSAAAQLFGGALRRERRALSDGELVSVLEAAAERGEFSSVDAEMVEGILRLSELCANDEMTPRVDMETYDSDLSPDKRASALAHARHHFLPVIRRSPDVVEGVYDRMTGKMEDALFVPETVTLDDLLLTFLRSRKRLAIVLDEYGGTAGIISPDDILELIFGPTVFARPEDEPSIVRKDTRTWVIDAEANLDEINRELGVELEAGDADRLSGWVAYHAERLPHVGQEIEADGCRATILKRRRHRVVLVRLEVVRAPSADSDEEILAETDEEVVKAEEDEN